MELVLSTAQNQVTVLTEAKGVTLEAKQAVLDFSANIPGRQGDVGPPGPAGGAGFELDIDSAIGGNRAVATVAGKGVYADSSDLTRPAIGISMGAASSGTVTLQSGSSMTVSGAGWTPGGTLYTGTNGVLTQTEPTTGFSQKLGVAHGTDVILIEICKHIIRS